MAEPPNITLRSLKIKTAEIARGMQGEFSHQWNFYELGKLSLQHHRRGHHSLFCPICSSVWNKLFYPRIFGSFHHPHELVCECDLTDQSMDRSGSTLQSQFTPPHNFDPDLGPESSRPSLVPSVEEWGLFFRIWWIKKSALEACRTFTSTKGVVSSPPYSADSRCF